MTLEIGIRTWLTEMSPTTLNSRTVSVAFTLLLHHTTNMGSNTFELASQFGFGKASTEALGEASEASNAAEGSPSYPSISCYWAALPPAYSSVNLQLLRPAPSLGRHRSIRNSRSGKRVRCAENLRFRRCLSPTARNLHMRHSPATDQDVVTVVVPTHDRAGASVI
jgi:hypothetical protein